MLISASIIWDTIYEQWIGIWLLIDTIIYHFISFLYQKFIVLASLRVFDGDVYGVITSSIYSVIGVIALFILAYQLLNVMINPDLSKSGETIKKVIINIISSMAMLTLVPAAFDFMFDFQNSILKHNVLGKLFLPTYTSQTDYGYDTDGDGIIDTEYTFNQEDIDSEFLKQYGSDASSQIFQGFLYPTNSQNESFSTAANQIIVENVSTIDPVVAGAANTGVCVGGIGLGLKIGTAINPGVGTAIGGGVGLVACGLSLGITALVDLFTQETVNMTLLDAYNYASTTGEFSQFKYFGEHIINGNITYHYIFSSIVGAIVVYILAMYCIDVAVRAIKLAFYQMIAPIPVIMRIIPNQEKVFKNWLSCVGSCYFEVFVRLAALYLAVFFIANVPDMISLALDDNSVAYDLATGSFGLGVFVKANIILGIFIFVKQIPNLISDVTGIKSGNFSLNIMDHIKDAAWAPAAVGGLIAGRGNPVAMVRAGMSGWKNNNLKGIGAETARRREIQEANRQGSTRLGRLGERTRRVLGLETGIEAANRQLEEGINPHTRNTFTAANDTSNAIQIRDNNGHVIRTINIGDNINMDRETQDQIAASKQYYAQQASQIAETVRHITSSENSNTQFISLRSALKTEALEKIAEEKSDLEDTISAGGRSFTGNLASMRAYFDRRKLEAADDDELKELTKQIGLAQDRLWENYARGAINGTINNAKIRNISDQIAQLYSQNGLQENAGVAYDRTADARGINALSGFDLVEELDKTAKEFNNNLVLQKQHEENNKSIIQEQTTGLERLSTQLKEQQDLVKHSDRYRATQANVNSSKNGGNN